MKTNITAILNWFQIAKPNPTIEDACVQVGCHYEEVWEMMVSLCDDDDDINIRANHYKNKNNVYLHHLDASEKTELLDALCDQIVTSVGVAYMLGMDIESALNEVNKSNWSKFENAQAIFEKNGKIKKGKDYFKPELSKFIGQSK